MSSPLQRNIDITTLTKQQLLEHKQSILVRLQQLEYKPTPETSCHALQVPTITKPTDTHTDYTHKELAWLSTDYASERKRQLSSAKKLSASITHHFASLPAKQKRERIEFEARTKRLAGRIARNVYKSYWKKIEHVVGYKQKLNGEMNKRQEMDRQLVRMVKETERYGERLRDGTDECDGYASIEEALKEGEFMNKQRRKNIDYTRMVDVPYESLYGENSDNDEEDEEYVLEESEDEEEKMEMFQSKKHEMIF